MRKRFFVLIAVAAFASLGCLVAEAGGVGQFVGQIYQMFGGQVLCASATTGQVPTKQSDGSWQPATPSVFTGGAVTTPITAANGTNTAPSYAFTSEPTLGLYRSAAGALGLGSTFSKLQFGGTSASFPALDYSGIGIRVVKADASGFGNFTADTVTCNSYLDLGNDASVVLGSSTGSDIGTTITQKLGFFGQAPIANTLALASATNIKWSTDTNISRDAAGVVDFGTGAAGSTAGSWKATNGTLATALNLGGTTASFPSVRRSNTEVDFRLADDSANAPVKAQSLTLSNMVSLNVSGSFVSAGMIHITDPTAGSATISGSREYEDGSNNPGTGIYINAGNGYTTGHGGSIELDPGTAGTSGDAYLTGATVHLVGAVTTPYALSAGSASLSTPLPVASGGTAVATATGNTVFASPSDGSSSAPAFRSLVAADVPSLAASKITTGQLAQARGGTGIDTSSATNGQLLIGKTSDGSLNLATLTGTSNQVTVTNGAGAITLSTPQNIHTSATPTFAGLTLGTTPLPLTSGGLGTGTATTGDLFYASGTNTISKLAIGSSTNVLTVTGGVPVWAASTTAGSSAGYIQPNSLRIKYASTSSVTVTSGVARADDNSADLTLAAAVSTLSLTTNAAALGMDRKTLTGTAGLSAGTVTGTSTLFLTEFGTRALSAGNLSSSGTAVTGAGTQFLADVRVLDLIGNATVGYSRVTAVASNTALTLAAAFPGGNAITGSLANVIENPTVGVGSAATTVKTITSNTSLLADDTSTSVSTGAAVYAGPLALTPNGSGKTTTRRWYSIWLVNGGSGTTVMASTQRTTLYGLSGYTTAKRRIGVVNTSEGSAGTTGDVIGFVQTGSGNDRYYAYDYPYTNFSDYPIYGTNGTNSVWTSLDLSLVVSPYSTRYGSRMEIYHPAGTVTMAIHARNSAYALPDANASPTYLEAYLLTDPNVFGDSECDATGGIQWRAPNDANTPYYLTIRGYWDQL